MRRYTLVVSGKEYVVDVQEVTADRFRVVLGDASYEVELSSDQDLAEAVITPEIVPARSLTNEYAIESPPAPYRPPEPDSLRPLPRAPHPPQPALPEEGFRAELRAPMPGRILSIQVAPGDKVAHAQTLLMLEAMKMKNAIKSPQDAVVAEVLVQPGQAVGHGDVLVRFKEASA